jgi:hypothetical protein
MPFHFQKPPSKFDTAEDIIALLGIDKGSEIEAMRVDLMKMRKAALGSLHHYLIERIENQKVEDQNANQ